MQIERKDKKCKARVLARNELGVLVEVTWPKNRNILFLRPEYFAEKYGS